MSFTDSLRELFPADAENKDALETELSKIDEMFAKYDADIKKIKREANKARDTDPAEVARLQEENETLQQRLQGAESEVKKLSKKYETDVAKLAEERDTSAKSLNDYVAKEQLSGAFRKAGVGKDSYINALLTMYKDQAQVEQSDNGVQVKVGDKGLDEFVKEWAASPEAADFITTHNTGGGATGEGGGTNGTKTIKRSEFFSLKPADQMAAMQEGAQVVDDQ